MATRRNVLRAAIAAAVAAAGIGFAPIAQPAIASEPTITKVYHVTVKCQLVRIDPYGTVGWVYGSGSGTTRNSAVTNAKKDADNSVPLGHYKRHCKEI